MAYDDIIIGSGLSGLAVALGLDPKRHVLVLTEPEPLQVQYYDAHSGVPSSARGLGGLGNFWHGVIPFSDAASFAPDCREAFEALFGHFYPRVNTARRYGAQWLYVPRNPIRPRQWWPRLVADRNERLKLLAVSATHVSGGDGRVTVQADGENHIAQRVWFCAGALGTPSLLTRSFGAPMGLRGTASDHAICYLGQVRRDVDTSSSTVRVEAEPTPQGYWFASLDTNASKALITAKPARFSYRTLDHGIEQRAAFGLPVGDVLSKVLRAGSLGLLSEAVFNKTGLFCQADVMSIYAQVPVSQAYRLDVATGELSTQLAKIRAATDAVRDTIQLPGLIPSGRPDLFIRGIHLHDTLDLGELAAHGINTSSARIRIADASVIGSIGGKHHSFHMMAKAYKAAKQV